MCATKHSRNVTEVTVLRKVLPAASNKSSIDSIAGIPNGSSSAAVVVEEQNSKKKSYTIMINIEIQVKQWAIAGHAGRVGRKVIRKEPDELH